MGQSRSIRWGDPQPCRTCRWWGGQQLIGISVAGLVDRWRGAKNLIALIALIALL
jgi:hypothetical protein